MTETLLFLHLLSAAVLVAGVAGLSARALGVQLGAGAMKVFYVFWNAGAAGAVIFGIWLALKVDGYEIWDAWILIALGLFLAAGGVVEKALATYRDTPGPLTSSAARLHWLGVGMIVLLLADMIWKPWA